jgi:hypothetical protein
MGAAASQRGDKVIGQQAWVEIQDTFAINELILMSNTAEDCILFAREAWSFIVEPRGLCKSTVEWSKTRRGWNKRHLRLIAAHNNWVDISPSDVKAYHYWSVMKAKAAYDLLIFCLGTFTIPTHINIPRAAK